jgi:Nuclease-related domain/Topoisomerase DNA binding C4 zinc finger
MVKISIHDTIIIITNLIRFKGCTMEIFLFVFIIIAAVFLSSPSVKGRVGEGEVKYHLRKLDRDKFIILHDTLLPCGDRETTQIDHIVISVAGVFVVETKNYRGWIFGNERSRQWTQTIYRQKQRFQNPLHQNYGHIKAIEHIIGEQIDVPYFNIVAFGSRAEIKAMEVHSSNTFVVPARQLPLLIQSHDQVFLSPAQMKGIEYRLQSRKVTYKGAGRDHRVKVKQIQKDKMERIKKGTCPKCGGSLVDRTSKKGGRSFKGCSNFPKCRFIG